MSKPVYATSTCICADPGLRSMAHTASEAGARDCRLPASHDRVRPESTMSSTMSTCRPVMSVSRSFRIRTTPEDLVPEPYEEIAIQSIWTGVVGVDLGRELADARLQPVSADEDLLESRSHVPFVQIILLRPWSCLLRCW